MKFKRRKRAHKPTTKQVTFRLWQNGIEYFCHITSPIFVDTYRLKEVFNREFIGNKKINLYEHQNKFLQLNEEITYNFVPVKGE